MGTSALYFSACGLQRLAQLQGIAAQHLGGGLLARPAQRNAIVCMARHHMQVKVKNGLIALAAIGLQQRQPRRVEDRLHGTGNPLGRLHDGRRLFGGDVQQGGRMAFGGHEHMAGVDLADVHEGDGQPVLVHRGGRDLARHQAAEDTLAGRRGVNKHGHGAGLRTVAKGMVVPLT